jgi:hypothetical protein
MSNIKNVNQIMYYQPVKTTREIVYKKTLIKSSNKEKCINNVYICDICNGEIATENPSTYGFYKECWFCWNY